MDVVVEGAQGRYHALHGHQHVLHHVVLLVQFAQGLALGQLQQGDLGRHQPAKEVAEDGVVAKGNDVLKDEGWGCREGTKDGASSCASSQALNRCLTCMTGFTPNGGV